MDDGLVIDAKRNPLDYLVSRHGHPDSWTVDGAPVLRGAIQHGEARVVVKLPARPAKKVCVVRDSRGEAFWEVEVNEGSSAEVAICLREK